MTFTQERGEAAVHHKTGPRNPQKWSLLNFQMTFALPCSVPHVIERFWGEFFYELALKILANSYTSGAPLCRPVHKD